MNDKSPIGVLFMFCFACLFIAVIFYGALSDSEAEKRKLAHDNQILTTENIELEIEASQVKK
jgi:hypothetical protein